MVKATEKTFPPESLKAVGETETPEKIVLAEPLLVKSVVSFKVTVPLVQYGNIEMFTSQEFYTQANEPDSKREILRASLLDTMRKQMTEQVLPLAEAEVLRAKSALVKEKYPDSWMQRNNPTYRWLRIAAPDLKILAMQDILDSRSEA